MKLSLLTATVPMIVLASTSALAATQMRQDCVDQLQYTVALANGDYSYNADGTTVAIDETARKNVVISNVRVVKSGPEAGGPDGGIWEEQSATISDGKNGERGTVLVRASRGGCFITKLNIHD